MPPIDPTDKDPCACATVCSLDTDQMATRVEELRRTVVPLVKHHRRATDEVVWVFDDRPATRSMVEEMVDFERKCCSGLAFEVAARAGEIVLSVRGRGAELFALDGET